ncbi:hypothetical protein [Clostridium tagluense]|uniref:hypothetical protein n=1 Tax=Clostridium tagluense TaxID=360422 RepID=UPI001CF1BD30|nr:hypothetical protein [Clostridium tagluense]MCB2300417.1 hypothetical protein [Clostridium tagluense]
MEIYCFNWTVCRIDYICNERTVLIMEKNKQTDANKKWQDKNKEHSNYLKDRSKARSFIKNKSTLEDLEELEQLIKERKNVL